VILRWLRAWRARKEAIRAQQEAEAKAIADDIDTELRNRSRPLKCQSCGSDRLRYMENYHFWQCQACGQIVGRTRYT